MNYQTITNIGKLINFDDCILVSDILNKSYYIEEIKANKYKLNNNQITERIFACDEFKIKVKGDNLNRKKAANKIYSEIIKKKLIQFDNQTNTNFHLIITIYIEGNENKKYLYECSRIKLKEETFINNKKYTHFNQIKRFLK
jgi:hypothetical protein